MDVFKSGFPGLLATGLDILVSIGGLSDIVVGPVVLVHIAELAELVTVLVHIVLISAAAQHPVGDDGDLGAGDGLIPLSTE